MLQSLIKSNCKAIVLRQWLKQSVRFTKFPNIIRKLFQLNYHFIIRLRLCRMFYFKLNGLIRLLCIQTLNAPSQKRLKKCRKISQRMKFIVPPLTIIPI